MANFKINIGNWVEYRADASPQTPTSSRLAYPWTLQGSPSTTGIAATTSALVKSGYAFTLGTLINGTAYGGFIHTSANTYPTGLISSERGYTVEAQVKGVLAGSNRGQIISISDGVYRHQLWINTADVRISTAYIAEGTQKYVMDTTDDFHTYRIVTKGSAVNVYVDNVKRITATLDSASTPFSRFFAWGDFVYGANQGGTFLWAYFKYTTAGAYVPTERAMDGWVFDKFDISEARRKSQFPIIRSDNVVTPVGKLNATKLKLSGTIAGTGYNSFRDSIRQLKRLLRSGVQRVSIDDERYIDALYTNMTLKPETQDYGKIKVSMVCQNPNFNQIYPQYYSTTPVSTATFYITNNSDVTVPCKIIITGSAAGTIDDAMTLINVDTDSEAAYRGVISATQELVVDKGFDTFNTYKIELDGSSVYNSYEGDMFALQSGVNAFVYTGTAAGTLEFYWREGYVA